MNKFSRNTHKGDDRGWQRGGRGEELEAAGQSLTAQGEVPHEAHTDGGVLWVGEPGKRRGTIGGSDMRDKSDESPWLGELPGETEMECIERGCV